MIAYAKFNGFLTGLFLKWNFSFRWHCHLVEFRAMPLTAETNQLALAEIIQHVFAMFNHFVVKLNNSSTMMQIWKAEKKVFTLFFFEKGQSFKKKFCCFWKNSGKNAYFFLSFSAVHTCIIVFFCLSWKFFSQVECFFQKLNCWSNGIQYIGHCALY